MTEKIRLRDGTEFTLIPMGIVNNEKIRYIKIISDLPYEDILSKFTDDDNISQIEYILADNSIGATYQDCISFKYLTFVPDAQIDDNTVSDIYVIALNIDAIEGKLRMTQQYIDQAICELTLLIYLGGAGL